VLIAGEGGARLVYRAAGDEEARDADATEQARWWCKSTHAVWLVAAVEAAEKRRQNADDAAGDAADLAHAVAVSAKRLGIALISDEDMAAEANAVIARLEQEIAAQSRNGALKAVNRAYRDYRLQATARGEKVLPYAQWMARYKAKLVREIAQNLRTL
jgi:hypothetical protein